jgi:hypothetical protein
MCIYMYIHAYMYTYIHTHMCTYIYICLGLYRVSQELRSLLRDLIPELILSHKHHIHMGTIRNGSGVMSF